MSQLTYRGNLLAASFPLLATDAGRTVILQQFDNTYNRVTSNSQSSDTIKDVGIPQIYYCENVMPKEQGFQSVAFTERVPSYTPALEFYATYRIRSVEGVITSLATTSGGLAVLNAGVWAIAYVTSTARTVTVANVEGKSYICIANVAILSYSNATRLLTPVVFTGLDPLLVSGVVASNGYLITYNTTDINWSSTVSPVDFVPSLATGAGSGKVEGVKANIVAVAQVLNGFIIYTELNAVAAVYSGNGRYPFNFREIVGSGGITSQELVSTDTASGEQYAYTTAGLQKVTTLGATTVYTEFTDFVSGRTIESFDFDTGKFTRRAVQTSLLKKLTVVSNRYILLSYGIAELEEVLVADIVTKRLGKLKLTHVDCIDWNLASLVDMDTPKKSIALMQKDGRVVTVSFEPLDQSNAVIVLGKYQHVRSRMVQMLHVSLDNIYPNMQCDVNLMTSLVGKDITGVKTLINTAPDSMGREYNCNAYGMNHSIALRGSFDLNTIQLLYSLGGDR